MSKKHYFLRCNGCGAPAADCVRICPYCGRATGFEDLGLTGGVERTKGGGMRIGGGAHVVIGRPDQSTRPCPFCGADVAPSESFCAHCNEKVVIETMRLARLEISGGSLVIGAGGSLEVIGRRVIPVHDAAKAGDLAAIKAAVIDGDDPNHPDPSGRTPLHWAAAYRSVDALRYLLSLGADVDTPDDDERTALHHAASNGYADIVSVLVSVGADTAHRDRGGATAADLARQAGHDAVAAML
jgi:hypothetical protein